MPLINGGSAPAQSNPRHAGYGVPTGDKNWAISSSSGGNSTSAGTVLNIASVTITSNGGPILLMMLPDGNTTYGSLISTNYTNGATGISLIRNGITIYTFVVGLNNVTNSNLFIPPGAFTTIDVPTRGTWTYNIGFNTQNGLNASANYLRLFAIEL